MPHRLTMLYFVRVKRIWRRIARSASTPENIALGAAIGMIVAMTPTVGLQMAIATSLCLAVRANPLPAIPMVWITNPLTVIPIYSFNYAIGRLLVGGPDHRQFLAEMEGVVQASHNLGLGEALTRLVNMGMDIMWPLWLGCFVVGFILAVPTYFLTMRSVIGIRDRRARRRAMREARLLGTHGEPGAADPDAPTAEGEGTPPDTVPGSVDANAEHVN